MKDNFKTALKHVLQYEGGWSDHPRDPGGATMKGVTLATFRRFYGDHRTKDDLRHITDTQLETIYKTGYWDKVRGDDLPSGIDLAVFDVAVNSGYDRAIKLLQGALGVTQDGVLGPKTLLRAQDLPPGTVIENLCNRRLHFLKSLSTWNTFGKGWSTRVLAVVKAAEELIP